VGNVGNEHQFPTGGLFQSSQDPDFAFGAIDGDSHHQLFLNLNHKDNPETFHQEQLKKFLILGACPHVLIFNFWLNHALYQMNDTGVHEKLSRETSHVEYYVGRLQSEHDCQRPKIFYMTPVVMVSERMEHLTASRSQDVSTWLRALTRPYGWVEMNYQALAIARAYDSTCTGDGLHPAHNVRAMLAQMVANHLCRG
jgi:hypothetical protein